MGKIYLSGNYWYFEWYCEVWKFKTQKEAIEFCKRGNFPHEINGGERTCKN